MIDRVQLFGSAVIEIRAGPAEEYWTSTVRLGAAYWYFEIHPPLYGLILVHTTPNRRFIIFILLLISMDKEKSIKDFEYFKREINSLLRDFEKNK